MKAEEKYRQTKQKPKAILEQNEGIPRGIFEKMLGGNGRNP